MNVETINNFSLPEFLNLTEKDLMPVVRLIENYLFLDKNYHIEDFMFFRSLKGNDKCLLTLHSKAGNDNYPGEKRPDEVIRVYFIKDKENKIIPTYFELKTSRNDLKENELGQEIYVHTERMRKELLIVGCLEDNAEIVDCRFDFCLYLLNKSRVYNYVYSFYRKDDQLEVSVKTEDMIEKIVLNRSPYKEIFNKKIQAYEIENFLLFLDICYHLKESDEYELSHLFDDICFDQIHKTDYHVKSLHILRKKELPTKQIVALLDIATIN